MKNKKVIIVFASIVLLAGVFSIWKYIYNTYYMIDTSPYQYVFASRFEESPDNKHSVGVNICKTTENSDIAYIMGILNTSGSNEPKTIFWQKINNGSIKEKTINGNTLGNWIDVTWLDAENVNINSISVNINRGYDYRRDWSTS